MRIVDTHCHLIYLDRLRYPWLEAEPCAQPRFPPRRTICAEAEPAGITDMIHMEVDVAEGDMEWETEFIGGLGVTAHDRRLSARIAGVRRRISIAPSGTRR